MDAFHIAKDDVDQMAAYWMMRKGRLLGWTGDLFTALVDPAFLYEDAIDEMMLAEYNMCFTEWLLYECKMLDGDTPLQLYLADPPTGASRRCSLACMKSSRPNSSRALRFLIRTPTTVSRSSAIYARVFAIRCSTRIYARSQAGGRYRDAHRAGRPHVADGGAGAPV